MTDYDIELRCSGDGWCGTFANILRQTIADITQEGSWSPAEVTLDDGTVLTGSIAQWHDGYFTITPNGGLPRIVDPDEVLGLRA